MVDFTDVCHVCLLCVFTFVPTGTVIQGIALTLSSGILFAMSGDLDS